MDSAELVDISPLLSARTAVFPGDTPFSRSVLLDFSQGHNLLLSSLNSTLHLGAHADAPNHYHPHGTDIASRPLSIYFGPCQVVTSRVARGERILPHHISHAEITAPRVLFRTLSQPNPDEWNDDFNSLSPELIEFLAQKKVCLVGIDTPSVDPHDSKALETHNAIYKHDFAVLEGLVLSNVDDGFYILMAFPLKIEGADASPVRAVLQRPLVTPA